MKLKNLLLVSYLAFLCFVWLPAMAQDRTITGKITDQKDGSSLAGVSVIAKGLTLGTVTNSDGNFKLVVPSSVNTVTVSYIGYKSQDVDVTNGTVFNVQLAPDETMLEEVQVVSIGYGTLDKREVSSAISHVDSKDLLRVASNNALMSIQGKVAGLSVANTASADPNSSPSVQLRGVSSRNAGLGPLYVINGIPGGSIENVNQNDIESIDVLKGGAASAIYGTRGSNGVIIITTKKGSDQSVFFYDGYASLDYITNKLNVLSKDDFVQYRVGSDQGQDYGGNTDWLKSVSNSPAFSHKQTVQLSGGSARSNYFASADYRDANGIDLRGNKEEYGARINLNHTSANDVYTLSLTAAPRYANVNNADYAGFNNALSLNPTLSIYDDQGRYAYINTGFFAPNPVENALVNQDRLEQKRLDISGSLKVNILKDLSTTVTVSEVSRSDKNMDFNPSTRSSIIHAGQTTKTNYASQQQEEWDTKNVEWTGNYALNIDRHSFKLLGGYSYASYNYKSFNANNYDIPFDFFLWNNLGSGSWNGGDKGNGQNAVGSTQNSSKLIAFFGRLNYSFDNKYIFTASLRREGSSKFGANNKWGNFPAVSAAWRLSDENFLKNKVSWLDDLKLRADYGVTGNQDFDNYKSLLLYSGAGFFMFNGVMYQVYGPSQNYNPLLGWEKAINFNIGLDFEMINHRLSGSLNYYIRKNEDLLGDYNVPLPPNPQPTTYTNVGTLKNSGFELQLNAAVIDKSNFKYNLSLTGSYIDNKFVSFSNDLYQGAPFQDRASLPAPGSPGPIQRLQERYRIGSFYTFRSAGVDENGALLVYNKDGEVIPGNTASNDDKQFVGNGLPKFNASLGNNFSYKNWDLSIFLRGNFGYKIFNTPAFYLGTPSSQADANVLTSAYDNSSKYSKLTSTSTTSIPSDYFLESGSFVKIDNIALGYTTKPIKSKYISKVRIYTTLRNVHTFTKYTGGDPDLININGLEPGVSTTLNYYPSTLQWIMGAQITF